MKPALKCIVAALLLVGSFSLNASDSDTDKVGVFATEHSGPIEWWTIPYPSRFDRELLTKEQSLIKVDGNGFVDENGEGFVFRGVNVADPGKLAYEGEWDKSLFEEIRRWGANHIRIPVHPLAWRQRGADWYFARIDEAISWANSLDLYLIIDWHSIGNLETELFQHPQYVTSAVETANFWKGIAHRYKGVATVAVYELFNEPTDDFIGSGKGSLGKSNWESWRNTLEDLIDLIHIYDSEVIPLVGGFNWAYDLGPVADKPVRRDGIAYAIHAYPQKAKPEVNTRAAFHEAWQEQWGWVAETYPVMATEIGWVREDGYGAHIPVINNDGSYGPNVMSFMEERGISWTAWCFDPAWSPTMIKDWDFTPTEQGRFFKKVMQRTRDGRMPLTVMPSPRVTEYDWMSIAEWQELHAEDVAIAAQGGVDLLFLGDSITQYWHEPTWESHFSNYKPANFGISTDKTQNLLWRLDNGSSGILNPRVVVIMIGVNNFEHDDDSAEDVFLGVEAIVEKVKLSFGEAQIVLLGILPYGVEPDTPNRQRVIEANALIAELSKDPGVDYYDIGGAYLLEDGSISPELMYDTLHPSEKGYEIFANELDPILQDLLK